MYLDRRILAFRSFQYFLGLSVTVRISMTSINDTNHFSFSLSRKVRICLSLNIFNSVCLLIINIFLNYLLFRCTVFSQNLASFRCSFLLIYGLFLWHDYEWTVIAQRVILEVNSEYLYSSFIIINHLI